MQVDSCCGNCKGRMISLIWVSVTVTWRLQKHQKTYMSKSLEQQQALIFFCMKNCIGGGNLVLTQAEGPGLVGWHYRVTAVLPSQPVHKWGTEMWGISVLCWRDAGAADAQLWVGSWMPEQCQLFLPSAMLDHWRVTWTLHSCSHPLQ